MIPVTAMPQRLAYRILPPLLLALLIPVATYGQDTTPDSRQSLAQDIRQAVEQLQQARVQRREAERSHRAAIERLRGQVDQLQADLDGVGQSLAEQAEQLETAKAGAARAQAQLSQTMTLLTRVRKTAQRVAAIVQQHVAGGIAYQRDSRIAALEEIQASLDESEPEAWGRATSSLWRLAGEALSSGSTIELINRPVAFEEGRRREHAWVLRIGLVSSLFVSEDAADAGVAASDPEKRWRLELSEGERLAAEQAIEILRNQAPPALVSVPYPVRTTGTEAGDGEGGS